MDDRLTPQERLALWQSIVDSNDCVDSESARMMIERIKAEIEKEKRNVK
jgi:hypothetical protein